MSKKIKYVFAGLNLVCSAIMVNSLYKRSVSLSNQTKPSARSIIGYGGVIVATLASVNASIESTRRAIQK